MLEDDGIEPLILTMFSKKMNYFDFLFKKWEKGHAVHLYKSNDKFGYNGYSYITAPIFDSVDDLVKSISKRGITKFTRFAIYNLRDDGKNWKEKDGYMVNRYFEFIDVRDN